MLASAAACPASPGQRRRECGERPDSGKAGGRRGKGREKVRAQPARHRQGDVGGRRWVGVWYIFEIRLGRREKRGRWWPGFSNVF
jgi:hypothetical protein